MACMLMQASSAWAQQASKSPEPVSLTPFQLFDVAQQATQHGDLGLAERALRALTTNPDIEIRTEARFRLAMLLVEKLHRPRDAATLLRQILDEKPKSARVRVELAKIQAMLGNTVAAAVELRAAEAAGLPPAVERDVRFFMQALDARRHVGASIEATLMPDSNINRATTAATIGTQIGDLLLTNDARERSGIGANLRGQSYARIDLSPHLRLLGTLSGAGTFYRRSMFDDMTLAPGVGPELTLRKDRLTLQFSPAWRWYGLRPYSQTLGANATWLHALGQRSQLRTDVSLGDMTNRFDANESGQIYSLGVSLDHSFSARFGGGVQTSAFRQTATLPAYAYTGGSASAHMFRELGHVTVSANLTYSHLEADEQLALLTRRRIDNMGSAVISVTLRQVHIANVSPVFRIHYENNRSSIAIYEYSRVSGEIGLAASF